MTSVPKPLKYMLPHIPTMKDVHKKITDKATRDFCADVVSVLMMVGDEQNGVLNYRLLGAQTGNIGDWGDCSLLAYVRAFSPCRT